MSALQFEVERLKLHQAEDHRRINEQKGLIDNATAHIADCNQDRVELHESLERFKDENLRLIRIATGYQEKPDLRVIEDSG